MYRPILASGAMLAAITLTQACRAAPSHSTPDMAFCPEHTRDGYLPPWEVAKAAALDSVISDMERHLGKSCWELLGRRMCRTLLAGMPSKVVGSHRTELCASSKPNAGKRLVPRQAAGECRWPPTRSSSSCHGRQTVACAANPRLVPSTTPSENDQQAHGQSNIGPHGAAGLQSALF